MKVTLFFALLLAACDTKPVLERKFGKEQKPHEETSVLQAADIAGHDGTRLRRKVEALKKANKKHNQAFDEALNGIR